MKNLNYRIIFMWILLVQSTVFYCQNLPIIGFGDATNYTIGYYSVPGSSGLDLHWYGGIRFGDRTSSSVMQITNGNVGIGTTTPNSKLEVTGGGITTSLSNINSTLTQRINTANPAITLGFGYSNSDTPFIQSYNSVGLTSNYLNFNPFGGNVGIGTITPNRKLEVKSGDSEQLVLTSTNASNLAGIYLNPANTTWTPFIGATGNDLVLHTSGAEKLRILSNGNVGIGTITPDTKLAVNGTIHTKEVKVDLLAPMVPDYVFANDYKLKTLQEVENYIKENNHLPEIPSAAEFEKNGLMLAEMNMSLLKKIEELTLYIIEQNKKLERQNEKILMLEEKVKTIELAAK